MHLLGTSGPAALGPSPGIVLGNTDALALVGKAEKLRERQRKISAWKRWDIYTENHDMHVMQRIANVQRDPTIRDEIKRHIDKSINLAIDVITDTSVVWKHGARREIEGATDGEKEAFNSLVTESRFSINAPRWNQQASFLGPVTVVPVLRGEDEDVRLTWDTLLPHFYEPVPNPADPFGTPLAVVWDLRPRHDHMMVIDDQDDREADWIVLDGESWRYVKMEGSTPQIVREDRHGLGFFPGATLRFDTAHDRSWWGIDKHSRLVDATITICHLLASLSFIRKAQNKKQLIMIGDLEGVPKGQTVAPERPLVADTGQNGTDVVNIQALDFDTSPENTIRHATWIMQSVARSYGGSINTSTTFGAEIEFPHEQLTEIRNAQIPFARDFEHELWQKAIALCKQLHHPKSVDLPDPETIKDGFSVEFPKLARTFADPKVEMEWNEWQLKMGLVRRSDLIRSGTPTLNEKQAQKRILDNIKADIPIIEALTKRNLSQNPNAQGDPAIKTTSQLNGEMGPVVRDAPQSDTSDSNNTED